jgi:hypothetical protein
MLLQRFALYLTLGLVLTSMNIAILDWQFWCILALFWAAEFLTRQATEHEAMAAGITAYLNMSVDDQNRIKKAYKDAVKEDNNG